jgi:acetyl esterase/lipase
MNNVILLLFILIAHCFAGSKFQTHILPGGAKLDIYLPRGDRHTSQCAMLVIPGGSYNGIVMKNEGILPAQKCNEDGIPAFVLSYHTRVKFPIPLNDAEEAMEYIRDNSGTLRINPKRVGTMGFSAGGHLAATLGTIGKKVCRPDFSVLFYPIISMYDSITHHTSRNNIIGKNAPDSLKELLSCYLQVSASTSPTFITHGNKDKTVSIKNSRLYYNALKSAGISVVFHTELNGVHGYNGNVFSGTTWMDDYQRFFELLFKTHLYVDMKLHSKCLLRPSKRVVRKELILTNKINLSPQINLLGRTIFHTPGLPGVYLNRISF